MDEKKQPTIAIYLSNENGVVCRELYVKGVLVIKESAPCEYIDLNNPLSVFLKFAFNGYNRDEPTLL